MESSLNLALIEAVQTGDEKAVQELLERGADPNAERSDEWVHKYAVTPVPAGVRVRRSPVLFIAIPRGTNLAKLLIAAGARIHPGPDEASPLAVAASAGRTALVREFLCLGLNVNHADRRGVTPLIAAAIEGHWDVVEVLLEAGADPTPTDWKGRTALDWAHLTKRRRIIDLLERGRQQA